MCFSYMVMNFVIEKFIDDLIGYFMGFEVWVVFKCICYMFYVWIGDCKDQWIFRCFFILFFVKYNFDICIFGKLLL